MVVAFYKDNIWAKLGKMLLTPVYTVRKDDKKRLFWKELYGILVVLKADKWKVFTVMLRLVEGAHMDRDGAGVLQKLAVLFFEVIFIGIGGAIELKQLLPMVMKVLIGLKVAHQSCSGLKGMRSEL